MATGWGRKSWGEDNWGDLSDTLVSVSGISLSSSVGSVSITANADVTPTGQSLTATNAGAVGGTSVSLTLTGISATVSPGQAVVGIGVPVTTAGSLSTSAGTATVDETKLTGEGWGRDAWGSFAWGDNYSVIATGQSLTSAQGSVVAKTDVDVSVTGLDLLTITQGLSSIQIDNNVFVFASEDQLDTAVGSTSQTGLANVVVTGNSASTSIGQVVPEPKIPVDVTGVSLTASIGTISLEQSTNETATGQSATISLGTVDPVAVYPVTTAGLLTSSVGSVTATGTAVFPVTGIGLTSNIGSVNVTAWSEIDPGVNNVWTEVDKAA
jgi:hypothetical protein